VRDGARAIQLATKACELTEWKNGGYLDTLAAAYARSGDFAQAVKWEEQSIASQDGADNGRQERLQLYRDGKAWPVN